MAERSYNVQGSIDLVDLIANNEGQTNNEQNHLIVSLWEIIRSNIDSALETRF